MGTGRDDGDGHRVAGQDANVVFTHLAGDVCRHHVAILELYPERRVGQGLDDLTFHLNGIFFGHTALNDLTGRELEHKARCSGNLPRPAQAHAVRLLPSGRRKRRRGRVYVLAQQCLKLTAGNGAGAKARQMTRG